MLKRHFKVNEARENRETEIERERERERDSAKLVSFMHAFLADFASFVKRYGIEEVLVKVSFCCGYGDLFF